MTDPRNDKFWNETAEEMRRALHLRPLTDEEAAQEYDAAPEVPMSEDEIEAALRLAKSRVPIEPSYADRTGTPGTDADIEREVGEVLGMHRNEGEADPEVEEDMERKRKEALEDDEDETTDGEGTKKS